jgi:hypothetical protein
MSHEDTQKVNGSEQERHQVLDTVIAFSNILSKIRSLIQMDSALRKVQDSVGFEGFRIQMDSQ